MSLDLCLTALVFSCIQTEWSLRQKDVCRGSPSRQWSGARRLDLLAWPGRPNLVPKWRQPAGSFASATTPVRLKDPGTPASYGILWSIMALSVAYYPCHHAMPAVFDLSNYSAQ